MIPLQPVLAYIDPGAGSFVFQMLIAGLLSLGLTLTNVRSRVLAFTRSLFRRRKLEVDAAETRLPPEP